MFWTNEGDFEYKQKHRVGWNFKKSGPAKFSTQQNELLLSSISFYGFIHITYNFWTRGFSDQVNSFFQVLITSHKETEIVI